MVLIDFFEITMLIITFSTCFSKQITPPNPRSEIYAELTSGEKAFREASKTQLASSTKNIREKTELTEKSTSTMGAAFRELLPLAAAHGIIGQQPSMSENRTSRGIIEIQRLVARAEKEPESAYLLGLFYLYGLESLSPDEEAAIGWFRKAAVSGHNDAQCAIGLLLYSLDKGVATSYFQLASNDGHSYGHWLLGRSLYEQASGKKNSPEHTNEVNQLLEEAAVLFDLVAGEIPEAAHLLAVMHEYYGLIPQEQNESQKSLQPSSSAWNFLRAAELYQQNSKRGFVESTFHLGLMYAYGRGLPQDYMRAAELFKRAATNHQQPHARRRFIAVQLVEAKYACNFQSITGTILERLTYFPDQPIRNIINFDSDSSNIQEFVQVLSKITGFHFEGSWKTLKVHVLMMDDPDGTIASHATMHKDGFVKLYTILALFGKGLLSFCDAISIPPRLTSLDGVAEKIVEIESHHLNLDEERVQMKEAFQCITKSGKDSEDYVPPSSKDLGRCAEMQLNNLMNGQAIDIRTQRSIGDVSKNECIMLEQCTVDAIKENNPDYYRETFGGAGSREMKVECITLIVGKNGQCFLIFPSFFLSYAPPSARTSFEVRFSVAKSFIVLATLLNRSGHLDDGKFLDLKRRMQCYLMEVRGLNGTISKPKGDLYSAIHNALPKGLVTHKSTNILPISKKLKVSVWASIYFRVTLGEETFGKLVNAMSGNSAIRLIENSKNKQRSAVPDWIAKNRQMSLPSKDKTNRTSFTPDEDKWDARLNELKNYILEHGTTPPTLNNKVGTWMMAQRAQYKNKAKGKTPALSDERVRKLDELEGFEWVGKKSNTSHMRLKAAEDKWDARLNELKNYILDHGVVPPSSNNKVGKWISVQRAQYKNKAKGKTPALSDERVRKLDELEGFEWVGSKANRPTK